MNTSFAGRSAWLTTFQTPYAYLLKTRHVNLNSASLIMLLSRCLRFGVLAAAWEANVVSTFPIGSAVDAARKLVPPAVRTSLNGELEGAEFWDEHDALLTQAWHELGPRRERLYTYDAAYEQAYVHQALHDAANEARNGKGEEVVRSLFHEVVPGVFASSKIFTTRFTEDMMTEL
eukprot:89335-Amphidinium_carterae.1